MSVEVVPASDTPIEDKVYPEGFYLAKVADAKSTKNNSVWIRLEITGTEVENGGEAAIGSSVDGFFEVAFDAERYEQMGWNVDSGRKKCERSSTILKNVFDIDVTEIDFEYPGQINEALGRECRVALLVRKNKKLKYLENQLNTSDTRLWEAV